jgi:hypothetical protein
MVTLFEMPYLKFGSKVMFQHCSVTVYLLSTQCCINLISCNELYQLLTFFIHIVGVEYNNHDILKLQCES